MNPNVSQIEAYLNKLKTISENYNISNVQCSAFPLEQVVEEMWIYCLKGQPVDTDTYTSSITAHIQELKNLNDPNTFVYYLDNARKQGQKIKSDLE